MVTQELFFALVAGFLGGLAAYKVYNWQTLQLLSTLDMITRRSYAVTAKRAQKDRVEDILRNSHEGRRPPGLAHPAWERANVDPLAIPTRET